MVKILKNGDKDGIFNIEVEGDEYKIIFPYSDLVKNSDVVGYIEYGMRSQSFILYPQGRIGYDYPEHLPKEVRRFIEKINDGVLQYR